MTDHATRLQQLSPAQQQQLIAKLQAVRHGQAPAWSPYAPLQVGMGGPALWFVHPAGGALFWYLALLKQLGPTYTAHGLQGHGLYGDQAPLSSIPAMAARYLPVIKAKQPVGPYTLIGYSIGGVIAFEVAQQLLEQGERIAQLILLDAYLYSERLPYPGNEIADEDERLLVRMLGALPDGQSRQLHTLLRRLPDHPARINYLFEAGRAIGRIPANYTLADLRRMYAAMAAHVDALAHYQPSTYAGQITFFRCTDRSESEIAPYRQWATVAQGGVRRFDVPGKHSTLLEEPQVQTVATILRGCLTGEEASG